MPVCPKCGGALWDNRQSKKNPKQPDYKCKDAGCDGVIWPPREPKRQAAPQQPSAPAPSTSDEPQGDVTKTELLARMCKVHGQIAKFVIEHESPLMETSQFGDSPEAVSARINTIFIQACQMNLHRP